MPQIKRSDVCRLRAHVIEFGDEIFSTDGSILYFKVLNVKVAAGKNAL